MSGYADSKTVVSRFLKTWYRRFQARSVRNCDGFKPQIATHRQYHQPGIKPRINSLNPPTFINSMCELHSERFRGWRNAATSHVTSSQGVRISQLPSANTRKYAWGPERRGPIFHRMDKLAEECATHAAFARGCLTFAQGNSWERCHSPYGVTDIVQTWQNTTMDSRLLTKPNLRGICFAVDN